MNIVLLIAAALALLTACSSSSPSEAPAPTQQAETADVPQAPVAVAADGLPVFAQREQRATYIDAMVAGDQRAIALLDEAIAQARAEAQPNAQRLAELEQARNDRATRLARHQAAR